MEEFQEGEVSTTLERVTSASVAVFYLKWSEEAMTGGTRGGVVRMYGPEGRHYFYSLQVPATSKSRAVSFQVIQNQEL